jgi:hypothetical protein
MEQVAGGIAGISLMHLQAFLNAMSHLGSHANDHRHFNSPLMCWNVSSHVLLQQSLLYSDVLQLL